MNMKHKIDRPRKMVIFYFDEPRLRTYKIEMPFDIWYKFSSEVNRKIAKSHHA